MNVLVLGMDHEIQRADAWRSDEMKTAYRNLLTALVAMTAKERSYGPPS
jgi:hypothetical protein